MATKKAKDLLDRMAEADAGSYRVSRRVLGTTALLCEDLAAIYRRIGDCFTATFSEAREQEVVVLSMMGACQRQLACACVSTMQARITDSLMQTRRAIEACAIARICYGDRTATDLWLNAPIDDRKQLRERFSTRKMFGEGSRIIQELRKRFDLCSSQTHASFHSIVRNLLRRKDTEGDVFWHTEIHHKGDLLQSFLWTIQTHSLILRVFEEMFARCIDAASVKEMRDTEERIDRHVAKWSSEMDSRFDWVKRQKPIGIDFTDR